MNVVAIVPAAGFGTRMAPAEAARKTRATLGEAPPAKQFIELGGIPILVRTLRKFAAVPRISAIFVALQKDDFPHLEKRLQEENLSKPVRLVEGGGHRQESVANCMRAVPPECEIVVVHDAVRPFVEVAQIERVIDEAQAKGAAILGIPVVDTVKQVETEAGQRAVIAGTIPRERIVLAQTPQAFRFALLKEAFERAEADGFFGSDEASLVERLGHPVTVVMGSDRNLKITKPADLELAEFLLTLEERAGSAEG